MFWLSTSTVVRLRDQLRAAGQKAAVSLGTGDEPTEDEVRTLKAELSPLCEAMYLMMSADGDVSLEEREVLSGAMRNLSNSVLDGDAIERMVEEARERADASGRGVRLDDVIATLAKDPPRAEVAFVLAAAIAFADNTIADEENETLDAFAEGLGIDETRADELLDAVEKDLRTPPAEPETT